MKYDIGNPSEATAENCPNKASQHQLATPSDRDLQLLTVHVGCSFVVNGILRDTRAPLLSSYFL